MFVRDPAPEIGEQGPNNRAASVVIKGFQDVLQAGWWGVHQLKGNLQKATTTTLRSSSFVSLIQFCAIFTWLGKTIREIISLCTSEGRHVVFDEMVAAHCNLVSSGL